MGVATVPDDDSDSDGEVMDMDDYEEEDDPVSPLIPITCCPYCPVHPYRLPSPLSRPHPLRRRWMGATISSEPAPMISTLPMITITGPPDCGCLDITR